VSLQSVGSPVEREIHRKGCAGRKITSTGRTASQQDGMVHDKQLGQLTPDFGCAADGATSSYLDNCESV
jgi:hypothetical protein